MVLSCNGNTPEPSRPVPCHVSEKDPRIVICKNCNAEISRGGASTKSFSTSGLIYHLKSKHPDCHSQYEKNAAQKRKINPSMPTPSVGTFLKRQEGFQVMVQRALRRKLWNSLPLMTSHSLL